MVEAVIIGVCATLGIAFFLTCGIQGVVAGLIAYVFIKMIWQTIATCAGLYE